MSSARPYSKLRVAATAALAALVSAVIVSAAPAPARAAGYTALGYADGFNYSACRASSTLLKVRAKSNNTVAGWSFIVNGKVPSAAYYSTGTKVALVAGNYSSVSVYIPSGTTVSLRLDEIGVGQGAVSYVKYGISAVGSC
jgi:hypothetical protein